MQERQGIQAPAFPLLDFPLFLALAFASLGFRSVSLWACFRRIFSDFLGHCFLFVFQSCALDVESPQDSPRQDYLLAFGFWPWSFDSALPLLQTPMWLNLFFRVAVPS